jgi:hypothetical protein
LDKITGKGYIVGNQGSDEIMVIPNKLEGGISFVEITPAGNAMSTAVDTTGVSVHSRNTIIDGKIMPS